jgi:hypothetical protein
MQAGTKLALTAMTATLLGVGTVASTAQDNRFESAAGCTREGSSRLPQDLRCGERPTDTVVITHQLEISTTVATPGAVIADCGAEISLVYSQRGALAQVEGVIDNPTCPASSGSFTVAVRTTGENGKAITQEFPETWERTDDQPVTFSAEYAIGDNVDLTRVRTLRSRCKCSGAAPEAVQAPPPSP